MWVFCSTDGSRFDNEFTRKNALVTPLEAAAGGTSALSWPRKVGQLQALRENAHDLQPLCGQSVAGGRWFAQGRNALNFHSELLMIP